MRAYLFGSYARNKERRGSDVDLLVEMEPVNYITLLDWVQMEVELSKLLRKKVEMGDVLGLDKYISPFVYKDKILIHER